MSLGRYLTCPIIDYVVPSSIKIKKIDVNIESHVSTSFIKMKIIYHNTNDKAINGKFMINTDHGRCIVSSCDIQLANGIIFSTSVIDPETVSYKPDQNLQAISKDNGNGNYNPDIFEMPFHSCPGHSDIIVSILYIRDMDLINGNYQLVVPITIPEHLFLNPNDIGNVVSIECLLYTGTVGCKWGSGSHPVKQIQTDDLNCIQFYYDPTKDAINSDFSFYYHVWTDDIVGNCIVQNGSSIKDEGAFVLFLSPSVDKANVIPRRIVFLLDHSGSMYGNSIMQAKEALITALNGLQSYDEFAICAFDHATVWYESDAAKSKEKKLQGNNSPILLNASKEDVQSAVTWVRNINADGATDILTPYNQSITKLNELVKEGHKLGMIVLITDGAVDNEHDICKAALKYTSEKNQGLSNNTAHSEMIRTFTFGIGPFCNTAFLKALAEIGHGYSQTCISVDNINGQMTQFMQKTNNPQLSGINLVITPNRDCENIDICPRNIPDLSSGSPLVIVGTFKGKFPSNVIIHGTTSKSEQKSITINCLVNKSIPITNLVARQKIDQLVGKWWLAGNDSYKKKEYRKEAVALAIATTTPCVFTNSIAYETVIRKNGPTIAPATTTVLAASQERRITNTKPNMKKGAILIGAAAGAAIIFGSVAATQSNISLQDVASFMNNSGFSTDMFTNFNIAVPNVDGVFGSVDMSSFTSMFSNVPTPDFGGESFPMMDTSLPGLDSIPSPSCCCIDACNIGAIFNCNMDSIGTCFNCNIDACSSCANGIGSLTGLCGECVGNIGAILSPLGDCLGGICECLGSVANSLGDE